MDEEEEEEGVSRSMSKVQTPGSDTYAHDMAHYSPTRGFRMQLVGEEDCLQKCELHPVGTGFPERF